MPVTINGDTGIVTPMYNGSITANAVTPSVNMKNRIINGAMVIAQRGTGSTSVQTSTTYASCDRWASYATQNSKYTVEQSSTAPTGFSNSLLATSSAATSLSASDYYVFAQPIEGFNFADLGFGTAQAKTICLSFWVRSSLTGTFGGALQNSAGNRSYPFTYTISAANTWEQKSVTIVGDTSGTWVGATNGIGITIYFGLGIGSTYSGTAGAWAGSNFIGATGATSVVGTNGATFYITGVQLEVGSTATSFDYRPYGTELALCQRYCYKNMAGSPYQNFGVGFNLNTTTARFNQTFPVSMRTAPTLTTTGTASNYAIYYSNTIYTATSAPSIDTNTDNENQLIFSVDVASGLTAGGASAMYSNNTATTYLLYTAEL
jgi:hypothetical protein